MKQILMVRCKDGLLISNLRGGIQFVKKTFLEDYILIEGYSDLPIVYMIEENTFRVQEEKGKTSKSFIILGNDKVEEFFKTLEWSKDITREEVEKRISLAGEIE